MVFTPRAPIRSRWQPPSRDIEVKTAPPKPEPDKVTLNTYSVTVDGKKVIVQAPTAYDAANKLGTSVFDSSVRRADVGCITPPKADVVWASGDKPMTSAEKEQTKQEHRYPDKDKEKTEDAPTRRRDSDSQFTREPEEPTGEPVMSRLEAAREWVRQFGPIPRSGSSGIADYKAGVEAIQQGETPIRGNVGITIYEVATQRGPKRFEAANEKQAEEMAESYGLEVSDVKKVGDRSLTYFQVKERIRKAAQNLNRRSVQTLLLFRDIVPEVIKDAEGNPLKIPTDAIPVRDGKTGSILLVSKAQWDSFPDKYKNIARDKGFAVMQEAIDKDYIQLADGQWISRKDWDRIKASDKELGTTYAEIGKTKGYAAMASAMQEMVADYEEFQQKIKSGEIIEIGNGDYISKEDWDGQPSGAQQILKEGGFKAYETATTLMWDKGNRPRGGVGSRFEERVAQWDALPDHIDHEEYKGLSVAERILYNPAPGSNQRYLALLAMPFVPPAKAGLAEYKLKDVSVIDWTMAAFNIALMGMALAPGSIATATAGVTRTAVITKNVIVKGVTASYSGLISYTVAKDWDNLSPLQRGLGIGMATLCAIPMLTTIARNVKISPSRPIATAQGQVTAWKGLSVAGHPIIGKSAGKWVLGTRGLTIPEARLILNGYHPEMMLETKVFVNARALKSAGFSESQIAYLMKTLKARNLFAGKASPWLDKQVLLEPTQRLNAAEINIVMNRLIKSSGNVKDAHLLYGSPTIKAQAAPGLRNWRPVHDWDISLKLNAAKTQSFTQTLLRELQAGGGGKYRINPKIPTLIEKWVNGKWQHIVDIHSLEAVTASALDIPTSKLDATGAYSYGRMVSEPAITVNYPKVGKLQIMRLSESGIRKADTILRVRQIQGSATAFRPPARGIAQPGVPKDAADFYVIVRTFLGRDIAEDWLTSWARAMGYTEAQLVKVLPRIRTAMLEVASQTPSDIIGYRFIPSTPGAVGVAGASPSITVHIPSSLGASISPSLLARITKPIYPYKLTQSPKVKADVSSALYSRYMSITPQSKSIFDIKGKISPVAMPVGYKYKAPKGLVSPVPSPSAVPSASPGVSPSPYPVPSAIPSPTPFPSPYPVSTPVSDIVPSGAKPVVIPRKKAKKGRQKIALGSITWKGGAVWKYIKPPWKQAKPITLREAPIGAVNIGEKTPEKTIQMIGKPKAKVPKSVSVDLGVVDILIEKYGKSISFTGKGLETVAGRSIAETTKGMSIPATAPQKVKGYTKLAFGTSLRSLSTEVYNTSIPKKFADKLLSQKLSNLSPQQIATEIKDSNISKERKAEILKMLPDRVRAQVELWLSFKAGYAPTRGMPKAKLVPTIFRRKKSKTKKVLNESEVTQSVSAMR